MMQPIIQYRLLGATVLIALSVVTLPMLMESQNPSFGNLVMDVPPAPDFQFEKSLGEFETLTRMEWPADPKTQEDEPVEPKPGLKAPPPVAITKKSSEPVIKAAEQQAKNELQLIKSAPHPAWSLQVATFSQMSNATSLQARLRSRGYPNYIRETKQDGKHLYRVYVGPQMSQLKAQAISEKLKNDFKLTPLLVKYRPEHT